MRDPMQAIKRKMNTTVLTRGRVVVIGAGGVGSCLLPPLGVFLSALSENITLLIADGDNFQIGNAYRVDIPAEGNKAKAWCNLLSKKTTSVHVRFAPEFIHKANEKELIKEGDIVFLCCDNHATRKLVSDRVGQLKNGVLISGGNDGVTKYTDGTCGNVQVYIREGGKNAQGCPLDKFNPAIANPADKNPEDMDCLEAAQQGDPQLGFANLAVASTMCNALTRLLMLPPGENMYDECVFDIKAGAASPAYLSRDKVDKKIVRRPPVKKAIKAGQPVAKARPKKIAARRR